jgi:hypothetical protein
MECAAIIDAFALLEVADAPEREAALGLLERIVAMLTKMCGWSRGLVNVAVNVNGGNC